MPLLTKCNVCSAQITFPDETAIVRCMYCQNKTSAASPTDEISSEKVKQWNERQNNC